jgi:hypothetical protein
MRVQIFNLAGLHRIEGEPVKDLFDLTRIDANQLEANQDLLSITDVERKGERVRIVKDKQSL